MASRMISKFEKILIVIHGVLAIATVLDPRFKMRLIKFYFPQTCESHYTVKNKRARELCCDLIKFYSSKSSIVEEPRRSTSTFYLTSKQDGSSSKTSLTNRKDRPTSSLKNLLIVWRMMLTMSNQSLIVIWMSLFYHERKTLTFCNGGN